MLTLCYKCIIYHEYSIVNSILLDLFSFSKHSYIISMNKCLLEIELLHLLAVCLRCALLGISIGLGLCVIAFLFSLVLLGCLVET